MCGESWHAIKGSPTTPVLRAGHLVSCLCVCVCVCVCVFGGLSNILYVGGGFVCGG